MTDIDEERALKRQLVELREHYQREAEPLIKRLCEIAARRPPPPIIIDWHGVHMTHCNIGDYEGSCKYGDAKCPALTSPPSPHGEL